MRLNPRLRVSWLLCSCFLVAILMSLALTYRLEAFFGFQLSLLFVTLGIGGLFLDFGTLLILVLFSIFSIGGYPAFPVSLLSLFISAYIPYAAKHGLSSARGIRGVSYAVVAALASSHLIMVILQFSFSRLGMFVEDALIISLWGAGLYVLLEYGFSRQQYFHTA